jgi:hypothetical protein
MQANTTHDIYEHPDGRREIVKSGFSWPAFFFGPLWAWRRGMFSLGFGLLALVLFLQLTPLLFIGLLGESAILLDLLVSIGVLTWIGRQGNAWIRTSVVKNGFKLVPASTRAD